MSLDRKLRVLVVDDSLFMRAAIKKLLEVDPHLAVVGLAKDGRDGVDQVAALRPDVVTMDFNMPRLDGAGAVREIMRQFPTPVVMLSAHTHEGARETFEALAAGAVDFLAKPSGEVSADFQGIGPQLVAKVRAAATAIPRVVTPATAPHRPAIGLSTWSPIGPKVVIVGISTGGPSALTRLVPALPGDTPFAMVIVQHMPAKFTGALAERLAGMSAVTVREAREGDRPHQSEVLIAPGDRHLEIDEKGRLHLDDGPEVNGCRPSADVTMKSAARVFGRRAVGVIMTGMGRDGAEGLLAIRQAGGRTLAQDRESCVIYGMPRAAVEIGAVEEEVSLDELAGRLQKV